MISNFIIKIILTFFPIFVFFVSDYFFSPKLSIVLAISVTILQFIIFLLKEKKADYFLILDLVLITVLGLISIYLENDRFFKFKPVIIEAILLPIIIFFTLRSDFLIEYVIRYSPIKIQPNEDIKKNLRKQLKVIGIIVTLHIILTIYSIYYMSTKEWAFISSTALYLMILGYFLTGLLINRIKNIGKEYIPVINENGEIKGKALKTELHKKIITGEKLLHPVIHLHIINLKGEILLQKRASSKDIQPDKWDTAVGGHVRFNESIEASLIRETKEELGIQLRAYKLIDKYIWESEIEKELVFTFASITDLVNTKSFKFNKKEISEIKFWNINEIENNKKSNIFTPNFLRELEVVKKFIKKHII